MNDAARRPRPLEQRETTLHVVQGEFRVIDAPGVVLTTILGSCVATCLCDPVAGVGGMNHFLLPGDPGEPGDSMKYGVNAMELLINDILRRGASRKRLEAKVFGGARMMQGLGDIGGKNAAFALEFLRAEAIPCVAQSLGGEQARRVRYWPATGRAAQMLIEGADVFVSEVRRQRHTPPPVAGELELF